MQELPSTQRRFVLKSRPVALPSAAHFSLDAVALARPDDGEVLVRVELVALSPWQGQRLKDFKNYTRPFAIGELIDCDVLGTVVASRTDSLAVGARVMGRLGWQEYATARPEGLEQVAPDVTSEMALTGLSSPGLTAYTAFDLFGGLIPGQTLVVTSAAGAVGSFAVQLGKVAGMRVVGIAGGEKKCGVVSRTLGADVAVDHLAPDFPQRLADALPGGAHLVFDTVGGGVADEIFENLAKFATVLIVGRSASNNSETPAVDMVNMRQLWAREATVHCFSRYSYPERWAAAKPRMAQLIADDRLTALVNVVEGIEQTPDALGDMLGGKFVGKVLVRYSKEG